MQWIELEVTPEEYFQLVRIFDRNCFKSEYNHDTKVLTVTKPPQARFFNFDTLPTVTRQEKE